MKKIRHEIIFALVCAAIFSGATFAQQSNSPVSTEEALTESVKLAPCEAKERLAAVKKLFAAMGVKDDEMSVEKYDKDSLANIVVRKKGKSADTIIIGAHYDKTADGCGAIDNWTGISIVAHLLKTLRQVETEKSYIFVAFDKEENGLFGSDAMAKAIPKENRAQYCAMINFDSFGFTVPFALQNASSSKLTAIAKKVGEENQFKLVEVAFYDADADSSSFKSRSIPAITFSGLDANWQKYLHSKNDQLEKIDMRSVYLGYRFGLLFAVKLDSMNCRETK
ncbi:MAG: M28 family metallopeptidase [Acidobacteriota bacterium]|nr:M28 family metallopeptidase [Acidobacteriota bacterium]